MNFIIVSSLIDTSLSDTFAIRYLTSFSKCDLKLFNLVEVEQELKDPYFYYMKRLGLMDYINDYVTPEENEDGIRLDFNLAYPKTIKAQSINLSNMGRIIKELKLMTTI